MCPARSAMAHIQRGSASVNEQDSRRLSTRIRFLENKNDPNGSFLFSGGSDETRTRDLCRDRAAL